MYNKCTNKFAKIYDTAMLAVNKNRKLHLGTTVASFPPFTLMSHVSIKQLRTAILQKARLGKKKPLMPLLQK